LKYDHIVKYLLDHKANPDAVDKSGKNALHWALERRNAEVLKILIKAGAKLVHNDEATIKEFFQSLCEDLYGSFQQHVEFMLHKQSLLPTIKALEEYCIHKTDNPSAWCMHMAECNAAYQYDKGDAL
jgi:ankyrin repeat protein